MIVPIAEISAESLRSIAESFVLREGTDYGLRELSLKDKVSRLRRQLDTGELRLLYDLDSEEWDLLTAAEAEEVLGS